MSIRRLAVLAAFAAPALASTASPAAPCAGPVAQSCTIVYEDEQFSCDVYIGTASGSSGTWACAKIAEDGHVIIGIDE